MRYTDKNKIPNIKNKGIYYIYIDDDLQYIGMSVNKTQGMKTRLEQFDLALNGIKNKHSGGERFYKEYGKDNFLERATISVIAFTSEDNTPAGSYRLDGVVKKAECDAIAEIIEKTSNKPKFNIL